MQALCDSIREYGVLSLLLARPTEDGFEIISGHRRKAAALKLGLDQLLVLVQDMTEDKAVIFSLYQKLQAVSILFSKFARLIVPYYCFRLCIKDQHHVYHGNTSSWNGYLCNIFFARQTNKILKHSNSFVLQKQSRKIRFGTIQQMINFSMTLVQIEKSIRAQSP